MTDFTRAMLTLKGVCGKANVEHAPKIVMLFRDRHEAEIFKCEIRQQINHILIANHENANPQMDRFRLAGMDICIGTERE